MRGSGPERSHRIDVIVKLLFEYEGTPDVQGCVPGERFGTCPSPRESSCECPLPERHRDIRRGCIPKLPAAVKTSKF